MRKVLLLLLSICCTISLLTAQQIINKTITFDGETREYTVFLPSGYSAGSSLPMVINMHGFTSNRTEQSLYSNFNSVADTANAIVVYPQGLHRTIVSGGAGNHWNSYFGTDVNDLGFIDTLIDYMYTDYDVDLSRVYATGMSNGGFMSYMLACELSDRIAAIASVTGAFSYPQIAACNPAQPTPVMQIHGTADSTVLFAGVPLFYPDITTGVNWWVTSNNCQDSTTTNLPDVNTNDGSTASLTVYDQCNSNVEVHYYIVTGGGHTWPGAFPFPGTNGDFWATEVIWQFFAQYQHPNPRSGTILPTKSITNQKAVTVYPNPFDDIVNISVENETIEQLILTDIMGRSIQEWSPSNVASFKITTENLNNGIYFLQVRTKEGWQTKKLVKR